jgi:hypothetical protein
MSINLYNMRPDVRPWQTHTELKCPVIYGCPYGIISLKFPKQRYYMPPVEFMYVRYFCWSKNAHAHYIMIKSNHDIIIAAVSAKNRQTSLGNLIRS